MAEHYEMVQIRNRVIHIKANLAKLLLLNIILMLFAVESFAQDVVSISNNRIEINVKYENSLINKDFCSLYQARDKKKSYLSFKNKYYKVDDDLIVKSPESNEISFKAMGSFIGFDVVEIIPNYIVDINSSTIPFPDVVVYSILVHGQASEVYKKLLKNKINNIDLFMYGDEPISYYEGAQAFGHHVIAITYYTKGKNHKTGEVGYPIGPWNNRILNKTKPMTQIDFVCINS